MKITEIQIPVFSVGNDIDMCQHVSGGPIVGRILNDMDEKISENGYITVRETKRIIYENIYPKNSKEFVELQINTILEDGDDVMGYTSLPLIIPDFSFSYQIKSKPCDLTRILNKNKKTKEIKNILSMISRMEGDLDKIKAYLKKEDYIYENHRN